MSYPCSTLPTHSLKPVAFHPDIPLPLLVVILKTFKTILVQEYSQAPIKIRLQTFAVIQTAVNFAAASEQKAQHLGQDLKVEVYSKLVYASKFLFISVREAEAPWARGHSGHEAPPMTNSLFYWHHPSNSNTLRIISTVSHQDEQDWTLVSSMRKGQCQRLMQWAMRYFHKNWLLSFQREVAPSFCYSYLTVLNVYSHT